MLIQSHFISKSARILIQIIIDVLHIHFSDAVKLKVKSSIRWSREANKFSSIHSFTSPINKFSPGLVHASVVALYAGSNGIAYSLKFNIFIFGEMSSFVRILILQHYVNSIFSLAIVSIRNKTTLDHQPPPTHIHNGAPFFVLLHRKWEGNQHE